MAKSDVQRIQNLIKSFTLRVEETRRVCDSSGAIKDLPELGIALGVLSNTLAELDTRPDQIDVGDTDALRRLVDRLSRLSDHRLTNRSAHQHAQPIPLNAFLRQAVDLMRNLVVGIQIGREQLAIAEIAEVIPGQKVAAYQFRVEDDRIEVYEASSLIAASDESLAAAARDVLIEQGRQVLDDLSQSNCSSRLLSSFERLQNRLLTHKNVVEVGMLNVSSSQITLASQDELSDTLFELLRAHTEGIYDYLAQFPDWQRFVQNSLSVKLGRHDLEDLISVTRTIKGLAQQNGTAVDASVPLALDTVGETAAEMEKPDGRIILALARTLENFISVVTKTAATLKADVASEARKWIARALLGALLGLPLAALAMIPGAEWIPPTLHQIAKQLTGK